MKYLVGDESGMLGIFSNEGDAEAFVASCGKGTLEPLHLEYPIFVLLEFEPEPRPRSYWARASLRLELERLRDSTIALPAEKIVANLYLLNGDFVSPHPCGWIDGRLAHDHLEARQLRETADPFELMASYL